MAKFPIYEEFSKKVAEKALDEFLYNGKSIREWMLIIASEDAISRQAAIASIKNLYPDIPIVDIFGARQKWLEKYAPYFECENAVEQLPPVAPQEKTGHCKDCKWWKDSDGVYRRGVGAESQCPINRKEVYEGNGYCFLYEPPEESEEYK